MTRPGSGQRIHGLNGLRTLALTGVLLFHMFPRTVPGGFFGVILFFVISGFLTAYSSVQSGRTAVIPYYLKRMKRIYPALILMIFITVEAVAVTDHFRLANTQPEVLSILLGYNNYWQILQRADYFANLSSNSPFTHLWYIAILIQFELIWPWLFRLARKLHRADTLRIMALLSLFLMPVLSFVPSVPQTVLYYGTFCRIHALLAGAYAGWKTAERKRNHHVRNIVSLPYFLFYFILTAVIWFTVSGQNQAIYCFGMPAYAIASLIAVELCTDAKNPLTPLLDRGFAGFCSTYSYEIYLWQYPVCSVFAILGLSSGLLNILMQFFVLLILSVWSHHFIRRLFP